MKVRPSVKKICEKCRVIRRHGSVRVISYSAGTQSLGAMSLVEALASRSGAETLPGDW